MAVKIQMRRDVAADWTSANPTLASGEIGVETDTGKIKLGDGSTAWSSLPYYRGISPEGVGVGKITVGASEPSSPAVGDLWIDTN